MFETAKLKLYRADVHYASLIHEARKFIQTRPYHIHTDFDAKEGAYGLRVEMTGEIPDMFSIIVGDVVHNLRSALEHVASDLYAYREGNHNRNKSKFLMFEDKTSLVNALEKSYIGKTYPEISDVIINIIKPYRLGNRPIWTLGKLWNIDKHRLTILAYAITQISGLKTIDSRQNSCTANVYVEQGRIIGITSSDIPMTIIDQGEVTFDFRFDEPNLLEGDHVFHFIPDMYRSVQQAIDTIEQTFNREYLKNPI